MRERMRRRAQEADRVSDATEAVLERQVAGWEPFGFSEGVVSLDSDRPLPGIMAAAAAALDTELAGASRAPEG